MDSRGASKPLLLQVSNLLADSHGASGPLLLVDSRAFGPLLLVDSRAFGPLGLCYMLSMLNTMYIVYSVFINKSVKSPMNPYSAGTC